MKAVIILCLMIVAGAPPLRGQPADSEAKCKQYLQNPLPAEAANIAPPKTWPDCESYKSYSGIGRKVDYVAARKCAWSERSAQQSGKAPDYDVGSYLGGSAMLTVLYANGEGVEQNTTLALRFAYPHTDTNAWLTLLTRNRYWSLRQTACRVGWNDQSCQSKEDE